MQPKSIKTTFFFWDTNLYFFGDDEEVKNHPENGGTPQKAEASRDFAGLLCIWKDDKFKAFPMIEFGLIFMYMQSATG